MLIIFEKQDKFHTVESIDDVVSAEIPSPITHPRLYKLVTSHMIHGPCGVEDPASPCMKDGKCGANFPKEFCPTTLLNVDGFPRYRRRELPPVPITRKSKTEPFNYHEFHVDNRNVVPYNKNLLLMFNAHINVEICTSVKSVKYIYKYIFKGILKSFYFSHCIVHFNKFIFDFTGFDRANLEIINNQLVYDEVMQYINARYVSAIEAMWRLLSFEMHKHSHSVKRLAVHLPMQQHVSYMKVCSNAFLFKMLVYYDD